MFVPQYPPLPRACVSHLLCNSKKFYQASYKKKTTKTKDLNFQKRNKIKKLSSKSFKLCNVLFESSYFFMALKYKKETSMNESV